MSAPPLVSLLQSDFIDLVQRLLPTEFWLPLTSPNGGFEIYQGHSAIGARVSLAIGNFQQAAYILSAPDGVQATVPVLFSRPNQPAGVSAVTLKAGTIVGTTAYGRQFQLTQDLGFSAGMLSATATVQALFAGEQWNVAGPYTTAKGEAVPGELSKVVSWVQSPAYGDPTFTVSNFAGGTGGVSSFLNQHGADRGYARGSGEPAALFRNRIRQLADNISPQAFVDAVTPLTQTYPQTGWDFIETWQSTFMEAYDVPSLNLGTPTFLGSVTGAGATAFSVNIDTNQFVWTDPRPPYPPFRCRWMDDNNYRGGVIIVAPVLASIAEQGMFYDDTKAKSPQALQTINGQRAVPAYDVPRNNFSGELQPAYDALDYAKNAVFVSLYATLQRIKAGGVAVSLELQGQ